nr:MAG TPA: helix-turn-helix domain protein [Caudoviricetes sp.]
MEFQEIFGIRIAARRKEFHLTQQQLGDLVGLSKQAINDIEHGRRSTIVAKALAIADALDTSVEYLAGVTEDPRKP